MLKKDEMFDILNPALKLEVDIMNRNAIIGLSMMYALWESKKRDLLSVITPFVLYCVGTITSVGHPVNINSVCKKMESEFGYKEIQPGVISHVLYRETKSSQIAKTPVISYTKQSYILKNNIDDFVSSFREKRLVCKERTEAVSKALASFLNEKRVYGRTNYSETEAETHFLSFFEKQGDSVLLSVEGLRQLLRKDNEMDYYIAKFILLEKEQQSSLFDHINELIVGYFITTAIYLQPDNLDITKAAFKDVTFYLDTPILLAYLGYKSDPENKSTQAMISSLLESGAKIACFDYNILEVHNILTAYRQSTFYGSKNPSGFTLEAFDEKGYSETNVEYEIRNFEKKLEYKKIKPIPFAEALEKMDLTSGLLDDSRIEEILLEIKPKYKLSTLPDDVKAINTISRLREGKRLDAIERCKAVFATTNVLLVAATKQYLKEQAINPGFPLAITSEELCVMTWLKTFERNNTLPQMRLLENVLAAMSPDKDLLDAYYSMLEQIENSGVISTDEAALLRIDLFARTELMDLTAGNKNRLSSETVITIKEKLIEKMKESSFKDGHEKGYADASTQYARKYDNSRVLICQQAEQEIRDKYMHIYPAAQKQSVILSWIIAAVFIAITITFYIISNGNVWGIVFGLVVTAIPTIQAVLVLVKKENWLSKYFKRIVEKKEENETDRKKEEYLSVLSKVAP